jgi:hypothetical protein
MNVQQTQSTIADYCKGLKDGSITVNREYQRSAKVWPAAARSFLIESLLLDFPIPKLSLRQVTDVKTRETRKEIVDGQQRSQAILDYSNDKFAISRKGAPLPIFGRRYSDLDDDIKQRFLDYGLPIDLFVGSTDEEIREVFRRINSYTVPLNAEEKRHAEYQGAFKWFVHRLTERYAQTLVNLGVFGERQLSRFQDAKLFSEIAHALLNGIQTTKALELNNLYRDYDSQFPQEELLEARFEKAFDLLVTFPVVVRSPLAKPHQFYALFLATTHALNPAEPLQQSYRRDHQVAVDRTLVEANFSLLVEALESDSQKFRRFVAAGAEKTNVGSQRVTRFRWYSRALEAQPIDASFE